MSEMTDEEVADYRHLRRWRTEMLEVMREWDAVHTALGFPAELGESVPVACAREARRLRRLVDEAESLGTKWLDGNGFWRNATPEVRLVAAEWVHATFGFGLDRVKALGVREDGSQWALVYDLDATGEIATVRRSGGMSPVVHVEKIRTSEIPTEVRTLIEQYGVEE